MEIGQMMVSVSQVADEVSGIARGIEEKII